MLGKLIINSVNFMSHIFIIVIFLKICTKNRISKQETSECCGRSDLVGIK